MDNRDMITTPIIDENGNYKMAEMPVIVHENAQNRLSGIIHKLIVAIIITQVFWMATWIVYWLVPQQESEVTVESSADGAAIYNQGDGDVFDAENIR